MTDEEINIFTQPTHNKIENIAKDKETMLRTLRADIESDDPMRIALMLYPELLRDGYCKETLKAIKKRATLDAMSGAIRCKNKRLFAIPDMYAACEYWFLGTENPEGILKADEVFSRIHLSCDKGDILRSPHLSMEHAVRKFSKDPRAIKWFVTKGIYTSCHDLITRILQLDVDGDQLNVVTNKEIIAPAERTIAKLGIVPLFYDGTKAPPEILNIENLFKGVKRAHDYSGIGVYSNMITRLWNKDNPDAMAAALICKTNNYTISKIVALCSNTYRKTW